MLDPALGPALLSIAMIAVGVLCWGAWRVWREGDRQKAVLMSLCAVVILGNMLIWTV